MMQICCLGAAERRKSISHLTREGSSDLQCVRSLTQGILQPHAGCLLTEGRMVEGTLALSCLPYMEAAG